MADRTMDIEKASDGKDGSLEITERDEPQYPVDNVPRSKGVFRKARSPPRILKINQASNPLAPSYGVSSIG
jgi:hypothetical protein